jgi:Distinct helicase family with a unique C-terminal domain including a metal-binding cysteine cluster
MKSLLDMTYEIIPLSADGGSPKTIMDHKTTPGQIECGEMTMDSLFGNTNPVDRYIIDTKRIPARTAAYSAYPAELLPEIQDYLRQSGIQKLYQHQADMFLQAIAGSNIVITTSTASGKTLSFLLPVLQQILKDPQSRAIFIYPTKALASDQYRALKPILDYFGKGKIDAGVYDGDTPVNERSRIRNSSNIILTNPEMLNSAFLPHHNQSGFNFIFSNLKFVIIDELHTYRGAFGSHLSNIFRRLNRVCHYYNSSPQFFCSSATIANPVELAQTICGKDFVLIDKDGSPAPEKQYTLVQPPYVGSDKAYRKPVSDIAAELVPYLTVTKHSFIAFCKSRKAVEVVLKESRDHLKNDGISGADYSGLISGYRGGYRPEERKEIERKMVNGQLRGLISTNALELGIDIGKIDTTVIAGYPGTRASFWQQSGRAGRSGFSSNTYFILDNLPFDQFIAVDPEWLFQSKSENAVVDPNNLFIQLAHVRAAAAELPLALDDIAVFPGFWARLFPFSSAHRSYAL